jgi:hypothetical protein
MLFVQRLAVRGGLTMSGSSDHDQSEQHGSHDNSLSAQKSAGSFRRFPPHCRYGQRTRRRSSSGHAESSKSVVDASRAVASSAQPIAFGMTEEAQAKQKTELRFEIRSSDLTTNGSFGALNAKTGNGRLLTDKTVSRISALDPERS